MSGPWVVSTTIEDRSQREWLEILAWLDLWAGDRGTGWEIEEVIVVALPRRNLWKVSFANKEVLVMFILTWA